MRHIAQLFQLSIRNLIARPEQTLKEVIEEVNQRRLTAKVQPQGLFFSACARQRLGHLTKHIDVRAAKTINRLFAIPDNKQICAFTPALLQGESLQQMSL